MGYVECRIAAPQTDDFVSDLEDEIEKLSSTASLSDSDQKRLKELKAELDNIIKKKEKYLEEHPEQHKLVYRTRRQPKDGQSSKPVAPVAGPEEEEEEGESPFTLIYFHSNRFTCMQRTPTTIFSCQKVLPPASRRKKRKKTPTMTSPCQRGPLRAAHVSCVHPFWCSVLINNMSGSTHTIAASHPASWFSSKHSRNAAATSWFSQHALSPSTSRIPHATAPAPTRLPWTPAAWLPTSTTSLRAATRWIHSRANGAL
jgi:hypothetical protein